MNLRLVDEYAKEKHRVPVGWSAYAFSAAKEDAPEGFIKVSGAVAPMKDNGEGRNWRKLDKATEMTFFVEKKAYEEWWNARADAKGVCRVCLGDLKVWCGWGVETGHRYRPCPKCQSHLPDIVTDERSVCSGLFGATTVTPQRPQRFATQYVSEGGRKA